MANISKPIKTTLFILGLLLGLQQSLYSQSLLGLDIDVNGQVHDVAYSPQLDAFIIGGEFTSVTYNGVSQSVSNLAVIKLDTLGFNENAILSLITPIGQQDYNSNTFKSPNAINPTLFAMSFDGPVYTIEACGNFLVIGGDFETVGSESRYHLAKFEYNFSQSYYQLDTFNPLDPNPSENFFPVRDIECHPDDPSLVYVNNVYRLSSAYGLAERRGLMQFNVVNNNITNLGSYANFDWLSLGDMYKVLTKYEVTVNFPFPPQTNRHVFMSGSNMNPGTAPSGGPGVSVGFTKIRNSNLDNSFNLTCNPFQIVSPSNQTVYDMAMVNDSMVAYLYPLQNNSHSLNFFNMYSGDCYDVNTFDVIYNSSVESYLGWTYVLGLNSTTPTIRGYNTNNLTYSSPGNLSSPTLFDWQSNLGSSNISGDWRGDKNIKFARNFMFASIPFMTAAEGQPRNGLAIYCLFPERVTGMNQASLLVCPNEQDVFYEATPSEDAYAYIWEYTGNGADINESGTNTDTTYISSASGYVAANEILIDFGSDVTPGQLVVTPMSICGETGEPFSISIGLHPLPNVQTSGDTTLTCARDSVKLGGTSSNSNITFQWIDFDQNVFPVDSITVDTSGSYVFQVTEGINNCSNFDTLVVSYDTLKPNVTVPFATFDLTCADTAVTLIGSTSSTHGEISWSQQNDPTIFQDSIVATLPTTYVMYVLDTLNGCTDSAFVGGFLDTDPPDIGLESYGPITVGTLDTVNCFNDTLILIPESSETNVIGYWTDTSTSSNFLTDTLKATGAGLYYLYGIDTIRGCDVIEAVLIAENFQQPDVIIDQSLSINCSADSVQLDAQSTYTNISVTWEDENQVPWNNLDYVQNQGWYYATVQRLDNGCTQTDSLNIDYQPIILVDIGDDTLACDGTQFNLTANVVGTFPSLTYQWNDGSTTPSVNYTYSGILPIVQVSDNNGCAGTDTLFVVEPPNPSPDFLSVLSCGEGSGSITINPTDGLGPFTFSLDGTNYQSNNQFTGLNSGTQQVWIEDSINCQYTYTTTIDDATVAPDANFLLPTYNAPMDSVVLIDVSSPQADSISWIVPNGFLVVEEREGMIILAANDTGAFTMQMTAYYGSCEVTVSKTLFVSEDFIRLGDQKAGINSIDLYPNPNQGAFTVEVDFGTTQRAQVFVYNVSGNTYYEKTFDLVDSIEEPIQLTNLVPGNYVLKVVGEFDSAQFTFVVQ